MEMTLTVNMDNAAFEGDGNGELQRILRTLADKIDAKGPHDQRILDANGNYVGQAIFDDGSI